MNLPITNFAVGFSNIFEVSDPKQFVPLRRVCHSNAIVDQNLFPLANVSKCGDGTDQTESGVFKPAI